mmetsp:Transcript_6448/g.19545  ORF Transcript_6448/g.19545 Transcript_6448/m.19545 type:complete len:314 (+) Transcript_6448:162-1103(+)|eukprot:CAMPEP_0198728678 /NCGR_PEP_ID=MMETSP1475-20131203/10876_1 /TAXON_ID= ORGANISM="Unidentified sp., Strain CCMP1999" /NCGR_SAMPLE_ID=MMETSP1475 /ASSEMBLY_ACC=CAM_ASM_001111 /LENGTH=313 /DNA_ID=CAMNT_0044491115 /DNA_START=81 /DNA_END=1022 /DNA_ORIENTATION=+
MTKGTFSVETIPDQGGKVAIVTGANIGLGLEIARVLAAKNAHVVLACRSVEKGENAKTKLEETIGKDAKVEVMRLDVSSIASAKEFAAEFKRRFQRLDMLMENAGVMALQSRRESEDGFELQLATNHIGHFVLAGELMPLLKATEGSRVVTQSSAANWNGKFDFEDLNAEKSYQRWSQYSMTKLANVVFATELQRRLNEKGLNSPTAYSVHPGYVYGQLQDNAAQGSFFEDLIYRVLKPLANTYAEGALPALLALTDPEAKPGSFYGPDGFFGGTFSGSSATSAKPNKLSSDEQTMRRLWEVTEGMAKYKFEI